MSIIFPVTEITSEFSVNSPLLWPQDSDTEPENPDYWAKYPLKARFTALE